MRVQQIRYVTANYGHLQGLRLLPLGCLFLLAAVARLDVLSWVPGVQTNGQLWFVPLLFMAIAAAYPIGAMYEARYGWIRQRYPLKIPGLLLIAAAWLGAPAVQQIWRVPLNLPGLLIGGCLVWLGSQAGALRWPYIPLGVLWLTVAAMRFRVFGWDADAVFYGLIGATLVVGGLGDHRVLTKLLHRQADEDTL